MPYSSVNLLPFPNSQYSIGSNIYKNMCINIAHGLLNIHNIKQRSRRSRVRVHRLICNRRGTEKEAGKEMKLKNLKLYLENQSIIEENKKLRKKADLLHQENMALMSRFPQMQLLLSTPLLQQD